MNFSKMLILSNNFIIYILKLCFCRILEHFFLLITIHSMLVLEIETQMSSVIGRLGSQRAKYLSSTLRYFTNIFHGLPSWDYKGILLEIFIWTWQGEVAISHRIDVKSYTSLHTLVNDMFPPTSLVEQVNFTYFMFWK